MSREPDGYNVQGPWWKVPCPHCGDRAQRSYWYTCSNQLCGLSLEETRFSVFDFPEVMEMHPEYFPEDEDLQDDESEVVPGMITCLLYTSPSPRD